MPPPPPRQLQSPTNAQILSPNSSESPDAVSQTPEPASSAPEDVSTNAEVDAGGTRANDTPLVDGLHSSDSEDGVEGRNIGWKDHVRQPSDDVDELF